MSLYIEAQLLKTIHAHGEAAFPEEGAGLLLGEIDGTGHQVKRLLEFENAREASARHNRYLITAQDMLRGEQEAARLGLDVVGVFHSHPNAPNRPSEFDREWALPNLSYIITSIQDGKAVESRAWQLEENRARFNEEQIIAIQRVP